MNAKALCLLLISCVFFQFAQAQSFKLTVAENGEASLKRASAEEKESIKGSAEIGIGDTLFTLADTDVSIKLESKSSLLVKGGSVVVLNAPAASDSGSESSINIMLGDGQVFLDRNQPHELYSLNIIANQYRFTPTGTAAAVKTTAQGAPTVAVLRGSVQMTSPRGGSVSVEARQFGTVNSAGVPVSGALNDKAVQQLEAWSGVKAAAAASQTAENKKAADENVKEKAAAPASASIPAPDSDSKVSAAAASDTSSAASAESAQAAEKDEAADTEKTAAAPSSGKASGSSTPFFSASKFELGAGVTTVNGEMWTRLALGVDVGVWKFGVFFDVELFIDPESKISDKGWNFKDDWADALFRKIRYIRYGQEHDPLFVKFGGLSDVTLGYGIIMDRFTNMLRYPDEKLLGLQVHLNDISPAGIYMQAMVSDFAETKDDGGIAALRLGFTPLKTTEIPFLNKLTLGASYAIDRNTHAPAKNWTTNSQDAILKDIHDKHPEFYDIYKDLYESHTGKDADEIIFKLGEEDLIRNNTRTFDLYGFDAGIPIIRHSLLNVDLYGQSAFRVDDVKGWGIGAPGIALSNRILKANIEYRKVEGQFTPGFFDRYYLDERLSRQLLQDKSQYIPNVSLNGVFGSAGVDVFGLIYLTSSYQYMMGKEDAKDKRYEVSAKLGQKVTNYIPKIGIVEFYAKNSSIGKDTNIKYDKDGNPFANGKLAGHFDRSPYLYWGYKAGFEISSGATLVWDYRYSWTVEGGKLVPDNFMTLQTALTF